MMRKHWPYVLGVILAAAAAAVIIWAVENSKNSSQNNTQSAAQTAKTGTSPKRACSIFTLADAKTILGDSAKGGANQIYYSNSNFVVSSCTYSQDTGGGSAAAPVSSAALLLQAPRTSAAVAADKRQFGQLKPAGVMNVKGYGSSAYWDGKLGQLNILKNNIWYIVSNGPSPPADRSLDQAEQLADLLINKM